MRRLKAIFLGSKPFGLAILRSLVAADPRVDWEVIRAPDPSDPHGCLPDFQQFCADLAIPFAVVDKPASAYRIIADRQPDFVMLCGWYSLLPETLLSLDAVFLGIHNSLLPTYRGGAPLVWSIINGEPVVGSSLFRVASGMDDGPVAFQARHMLADDEDVADATRAIEDQYVAELPRLWPKIIAGDVVFHAQDESKATYCGQRVPQDGEIDWSMPAHRIHDFVRAQSRPYPGAFTAVDGRTVRIWRTSQFPRPYLGSPGQLLRRKDQVIVACGSGSAIIIHQAESDDGETDLARLFPRLSLRLRTPASTDARTQDAGPIGDLHDRLKEFWKIRREEIDRPYSRTLPFGEYVVDRWEKAAALGFGDGTSVYDSALIYGDVKVGRKTWIGPFTLLDGSGGLTIGDNCSISSGVQIYTHDSVAWALSGGTAPYERAPTHIGNNCYIGPNSIIVKGVTIGDGVVVGAGSLVLHDIPAGSRAWGVPSQIRDSGGAEE